MADRAFRTAEVARFLGVTPQAVISWHKEGLMRPSFRRVGAARERRLFGRHPCLAGEEPHGALLPPGAKKVLAVLLDYTVGGVTRQGAR